MSGSAAWLMDFGGGVLAAMSVTHVLHVLEDMSLVHRVPLAPAHCNRVLVWQQQLLPVVDLAQLKAPELTAALSQPGRAYACVLGWRIANDATEYGVLLTRSLPRRIVIADDSMVAPSASEASTWQGSALSFFSYHGRTAPIIDPAPLFGLPPPSRDAIAPQGRHL